MTILIVAITHGRTKEEWYKWVTERVQSGVGYETPDYVPQLYSQSRLMSFRARQEAMEARNRLQDDEPEPSHPFNGDEFLRKYGLRVTTLSGGGGGISYRPGGAIVNDSGQLMFGSDESDEEDSEEEGIKAGSGSFFSETLGLGRSESPDPTKNLKAQLDEYEKDIQNEDIDMDAKSDEKSSSGMFFPHFIICL